MDKIKVFSVMRKEGLNDEYSFNELNEKITKFMNENGLSIKSIYFTTDIKNSNMLLANVVFSTNSQEYIKKEKCWICGKELNSSNMSNIMYLTNPPKYSCIDCENKKMNNISNVSKLIKICPQKKGENCPFPLGTHCDECEYK